MKTIIIKQLHLLNFKGVRDLTIDFVSHETDIFGRNGSGKTTVFDAFTWLLFGKDSQNRTEFDLKTLDTNGKIIYKLPHEVSATIAVDGVDITLCRRLVEKFPKRNGEPTFAGNQIERLFNDVPCNEREFTAKIAEICDEDTFKKITSPTFFVSQSSDKQKSDLMRMAGEINDAEIAAGNPEFEMLLSRLANKTIDELEREIRAKKGRVKTEIDDIPGRIDERERDIAERTDDWSAIEHDIAAVTAERDAVDAQLTDIDTAARAAADARYKHNAEIARKRVEYESRRQQLKTDAMTAYNERQLTISRIDNDIAAEQHTFTRLTRSIADDRAALNDKNERRARMLETYAALNAKSKQIAAEQIVFNDNDFVCPTCHRPLEIDDIAERQLELTERFNAERQSRLNTVAAEIAANIDAGKRLKTQIVKTENDIAEANDALNGCRERIDALTAKKSSIADVTMPEMQPIYDNDDELKRIAGEIEKIESVCNDEPESMNANRDALKTQRAELNAQLDALKTRIAHRQSVADSKQRIAELEKRYRALNDELNELEHIEYVIAEFSKAKSELIDTRINGMFNVVRFRWLKYMINGTERETCEATINGVPYQSLNAAGRIAAGIDIINAICRFEGITAPIFIDNRESILAIPPVESQIVNLIVSPEYETLTVKQHNKN